jgi:NAD(P)H-nitrite reductase large subunit
LLSTAANLDALEFDILCICTGVIPETDLAKDAGLEVGRGIFIDKFSRTTVPNVYAAGDCTESYSAVTEKRAAVPILPNAYIQGETAGLNMAGVAAAYDSAMPMNAIGFLGKHILTAGVYEGEEIRSASSEYRKIFVKDGKLKGFIFIDDFKRAGIYTALIREGRDISEVDARELADYAGLNIYPKEFRDAALRK